MTPKNMLVADSISEGVAIDYVCSFAAQPGLGIDWSSLIMPLDGSKLLPAKVVPSMTPPQAKLAKPTRKVNSSREPASCRRFVQNDESSGDETCEFFPLLRDATEAECLEAIRAASVQVLNKADTDRRTALHHMVRRNMKNVSRAILSRPDFEALQVWDKDGYTAMHIAVQQEDAALCRIFLEKDATLALVENSAGETTAELAMRLGNRLIIEVFQACRCRSRA
mmetsp:Transcript_97729/g.174100  ORF Transcript_97729/g.174100 Transcript_97729/m.174100 type:complete len:224 (+) Transcript_97729:61-732(+)